MHRLMYCNLQELPEFYQDLATCDPQAIAWSKSAIELLNNAQADVLPSEDEEENPSHALSSVNSLNKAMDMARDLQLFCAEKGLEEALVHTDALDDALMNAWYIKKAAARQTKMSDFLLPVSK